MEAETKVEIISRNIIKPSTPTPQQNRIFKLSLLDQVIPSIYVPLIMFYSSKTNSNGNSSLEISEISNNLKKSLSETLVNFYPFAGRQKDESSIDCNDEGACFAEAQVNCKLSDFLKNPDFKLLVNLLLTPFTSVTSEVSAADNAILHVQLTCFSCGGIAIAISISHKVADGFSCCSFLQNWSAITQGHWSLVPPKFISASILPALNHFPSTFTWNFHGETWTTRRFVFHVSKLASLKVKFEAVTGSPPTKVELVTALLFKCFLAASQSMLGSFRPSVLYQAVNLRPRMTPPLPQNTIGNFSLSFPVLVEESNTQLDDILIKMRKGFADFCSEIAKRLNADSGVQWLFERIKEQAELASRDVSMCIFTSLCNFPSYEIANFGLGQPVWMTCPMHSMPFFVLTDSKARDAIEVWATLDEQVMAKMESDELLLQYASINPSVFSA